MAYYNPSTGRFLSRDPRGELGFQVMQRAGAGTQGGTSDAAASPSGGRVFDRQGVAAISSRELDGKIFERSKVELPDEDPNSYSFVQNDPVQKIDRLGLAPGQWPDEPPIDWDDSGPSYTYGDIRQWPKCCEVCKRQIMPDDHDSWRDWLRLKHYFIRCPPGKGGKTFSFPWGEDPHEDDHTVQCAPIYVNPCTKTCDEFTQCIEGMPWGDASVYSTLRFNCHDAYLRAKRVCGGTVISGGFAN